MLDFDGTLKDANDTEISVTCKIIYPPSKESPTLVEIYAISPVYERLENPCQIVANNRRSKIILKNVWYRNLEISLTEKKFHFDSINLTHIESLNISTQVPYKDRRFLRAYLSHANYLKEHHLSKNAQYSQSPNQEVGLFKLNIEGLGEVKFFKRWSIHHIKGSKANAEIFDDYVAEIDVENNPDYIKACNIFKESLFAISVVFRQAVAILRWEYKVDGEVVVSIPTPLSPNIPPFVHNELDFSLTTEEEFESCAESLINGYLALDSDYKKQFKEISISIAPFFLERSEQRFVSMYGAFERTVGLMKVKNSETEKLDSSNAAVINELNKSIASLDDSLGDLLGDVKKRLRGFIKSVRSKQLSFSAKLILMRQKYPNLSFFEKDLWPIEGDDSTLSLREIRNRLTHSAIASVDHQVTAVAEWHFSILLERLLFIICCKPVPKGIGMYSIYLHSSWYSIGYWQPLTKVTEDDSENK